MATPVFNYCGEYNENWPLPAKLTRKQYDRVIFRPDAHFVDGAIVPRSLGNSVRGNTVGAVCTALQDSAPNERLNLCISLRLQTPSTRVRVCDVVILRPGAPREDVPTLAPLLCVEVLSPDQLPGEEQSVLADYLAMSVDNIWLIDPARRAAWTFDVNGLREADPTNLTVPGTPIRVDLTEAFPTLD